MSGKRFLYTLGKAFGGELGCNKTWEREWQVNRGVTSGYGVYGAAPRRRTIRHHDHRTNEASIGGPSRDQVSSDRQSHDGGDGEGEGQAVTAEGGQCTRTCPVACWTVDSLEDMKPRYNHDYKTPLYDSA